MKITDANITRDHNWAWFIAYVNRVVTEHFGKDAADSISKMGGTLAWDKCEQGFFRYEEKTRYNGEKFKASFHMVAVFNYDAHTLEIFQEEYDFDLQKRVRKEYNA
jgi:hypothetical protein